MTAALLGALASAERPTADVRAGTLLPRRLAIYYGIPSLVNGARGDLARAAAAFSDYDVVVFGDGLEFPDVAAGRVPNGAGAVERRNTAAITRLLSTTGRKPIVFGYIDLGHSQKLAVQEIEHRIALWREVGAAGIFFDEAGYDFGVDRLRQNAAVDAAHAAGLRVFMNAFNPDDVFAPSHGIPHHLGPGDAYLLESFVVRNGAVNDAGWSARASRAVSYADRADVDVHAVTTTIGSSGTTPELVAYAWWTAVAYGLDGFGWGEPSFSGPDSLLPWRARPEDAATAIGDRFVGGVTASDGIYSRRTDRGRIDIDTRLRSARFLLSR